MARLNAILYLIVVVLLMLWFVIESPPHAPSTHPTAATVDPARLIVEGQSVGPVRLGMTEPELIEVLGQPSTKEELEDGDLLEFRERHILVQLTRPMHSFDPSQRPIKRVRAILVKSEEFTTRDGLRVQTPQPLVVEKLGPARESTESLFYDSRGIMFFLSDPPDSPDDPPRRVATIMVYSPEGVASPQPEPHATTEDSVEPTATEVP